MVAEAVAGNCCGALAQQRLNLGGAGQGRRAKRAGVEIAAQLVQRVDLDAVADAVLVADQAIEFDVQGVGPHSQGTSDFSLLYQRIGTLPKCLKRGPTKLAAYATSGSSMIITSLVTSVDFWWCINLFLSREH